MKSNISQEEQKKQRLNIFDTLNIKELPNLQKYESNLIETLEEYFEQKKNLSLLDLKNNKDLSDEEIEKILSDYLKTGRKMKLTMNTFLNTHRKHNKKILTQYQRIQDDLVLSETGQKKQKIQEKQVIKKGLKDKRELQMIGYNRKMIKNNHNPDDYDFEDSTSPMMSISRSKSPVPQKKVKNSDDPDIHEEIDEFEMQEEIKKQEEQFENKYIYIAKKCYICKQRFHKVHHYYDQMCPLCATLNYSKRFLKSDLSGKIGLVTGGRVKIGYQICLSLLRNNIQLLIVTSRFPKDTLLRFSQEEDYNSFKDRIQIHGLDFRDLQSVYQFTQHLNRTLPKLDILINNSAQSIRRHPRYYYHLMQLENSDPSQLAQICNIDEETVNKNLPTDFIYNQQLQEAAIKKLEQQAQKQPIYFLTQESTKLLNKQQSSDLNLTLKRNSSKKDGMEVEGQQQQQQDIDTQLIKQFSFSDKYQIAHDNHQEMEFIQIQSNNIRENTKNLSYSAIISQIPMIKEDFLPLAQVQEFLPPQLLDVNCQQVDLSKNNSWVSNLQNIDFIEFIEVQMVNQWAPYIIIQQLQPLLESQNSDLKEKRFIVNVSSMEGKFNRYKSFNHPHTNMAKAGLNMLTRTSGSEFAKKNIYMNAADTGWVTEMNPNSQNIKKTVPLDEIDGAMRVLDCVYTGFNTGFVEYSKFYKDYHHTEW